MQGLQLLVIPGSVRAGSLNRRLAAVASAMARQAGAEVSEFDLRALDLPVYDGDLEAASGVPDAASRLRDALAAADAVLVVTPEYNGFPTPLLINAFDWLSRVPVQGDRPAGRAATANKPVALLSASPGPQGGLRAMNFLRAYLQGAFAMLVQPQQFALGHAAKAFDADGSLSDEGNRHAVSGVVAALGRLAAALAAARRARAG